MQGPFQACLTAHGDRCKLWKPSENLADGCKVGVTSDVVFVMYVVTISKAELQAKISLDQNEAEMKQNNQHKKRKKTDV